MYYCRDICVKNLTQISHRNIFEVIKCIIVADLCQKQFREEAISSFFMFPYFNIKARSTFRVFL